MTARHRIAGLFVAGLGLLSLGASSANAQSIRYFVFGPQGLDEVREGSGTGGRFVAYGSPRNECGLMVGGYTDRAQRGDYLFVLVEGLGVAQYVGVRSDNNVLNFRVSNVGLPAYAFQRVSLSPFVDNVYSYVKLPGRSEVAKRLPIGTR